MMIAIEFTLSIFVLESESVMIVGGLLSI